MTRSVRLGITTLAILTSSVSWAQAGTPPIWAEEFNGETLDLSTWTNDTGGGGFGNQELQYYTARNQNIRVENGNLVITAIRENYQGKEFTSARIKSHGRFSFRYGSLEARIKVPNLANGLWPAFWLLGANIGQNTWPACGETDILEMGSSTAINSGVTDRWVSAAAHWDFMGSYALYNQAVTTPTPLTGGYHNYRLDWTPTLMTVSVDGAQYWAFDISSGESNSLEEFHRPHFILLNMAVGGINFVEILDPNQITAPMPAELMVDWIRLYANPFTELHYGADEAETGTFGVFTETTPVDNALAYGADAELYLWNNLTAVPTTPFEGAEAWSFVANPGDWFGGGVFLLSDRNMANFSNGYLRFNMKTTSTHPIRFGVKSSAAGEFWLSLIEGGEQFGLIRDGQWHEVAIPLARFANVDFNTIGQIFMFAGDPPAATVQFSIDNVRWTASVAKPTPENGNFGIFTETPSNKTAGEFGLGVDGEFYIWENTLVDRPTNPYEGSSSISLGSAPGPLWFGAAFTPNIKYDLSAFRYPDSRLRVAMKTSSPVKFQIGMKSGGINDIGQTWIDFVSGADPYGFARDGQWHVLEIPMSDFPEVDLSDVSQLFELLGVDGPISDIEIDDIALINGGSAQNSNTPIPGDMDCSGEVTTADIPLFAEALLDPAGFDLAHPSCLSDQADMDASGSPDGEDIQQFVETLIGA
ncbi:MAG TPA: glycoside hydrolase family 16 protein [Phycisphaerae bacterium]|nr:glycoside hydrolase family 16 protein [Phycisphaerae bacterium]HRW52683.1 glycoside hydrolase family 16 protein [Phycisphaerae bacterium]